MTGRGVTRRGFLQASAVSSAGLVIAFYVPGRARAAPPPQPNKPPPQPNAFVRVAPDDTVTVLLAHSEMGQGIWTGLAMLVAEELECDWSKVRVEHAPAAPAFRICSNDDQLVVEPPVICMPNALCA